MTMSSLPASTAQEPERKAELETACLVTSAGYVDGYGLFAFNTFVSFMSGNSTLTGYHVGRGELGAAIPTGVAILAFVCGATAGSLIGRRRGGYTLVLVTTATLEALAMSASDPRWKMTTLAIAVLGLAMGVLNHAVTHVGSKRVSLTFVTGTLARIGDHLADAVSGAPLADATGPRDTHSHRAAQLTLVWLSFFVGAAVAGLLAPRLGGWTLAPPIVLHLFLAMAAVRGRAH
jgi:uncharacterized membrane protein YoaK (UPF0700 family)